MGDRRQMAHALLSDSLDLPANGRVYRGAEDPNDVVVLFEVASVEKARTWVAGQDLKTAMQQAGVLGAPMIDFTDKHQSRAVGEADRRRGSDPRRRDEQRQRQD
jgi:hypothetical protein